MRQRWYGPEVARRLPGNVLGILCCGLAIALMARSGLGLGPWETLQQGIGRQTGLEIGTVSIVLGIPILLLWIPLRVPAGIGTVINVVLIGTSVNVFLASLPAATGLPIQVGFEVIALVLLGVGSGLYLAADLGPGPRDGLMTGLHRRTGWRIAYVRTGLEVGVLVAGFLLGGTIGMGTVLFALATGAAVELGLRTFDRHGRVILRRRTLGMEPVPAEGAA